MRSLACSVLVLAVACVNAQHAEVRLTNNAPGVDCFTRCVQASAGPAAVDCVARCPGAHRDGGDCGDGAACVEHRTMSTGRTALLVIGGAVLIGFVTAQ